MSETLAAETARPLYLCIEILQRGTSRGAATLILNTVPKFVDYSIVYFRLITLNNAPVGCAPLDDCTASPKNALNDPSFVSPARIRVGGANLPQS